MFESSQPAVKLILHSDQSYERTTEIDSQLIRSLSGKRQPRLGYVPSVPDPRRRFFAEKMRYYDKMGLTSVEYFDPVEDCDTPRINQLFECDVIHLSGGEVCRFMERLVSSGVCDRLKSFAARGGVLVGVSAGAMLLGRTFAAATLYGERGETNGLGFFDFEIVPHVNEHFPRLDLLRSFSNKIRKTVYALNDGDVIVISGKKIRTFGAPIKIDPA